MAPKISNSPQMVYFWVRFGGDGGGVWPRSSTDRIEVS
jgi:hypothetical protein